MVRFFLTPPTMLALSSGESIAPPPPVRRLSRSTGAVDDILAVKLFMSSGVTETMLFLAEKEATPPPPTEAESARGGTGILGMLEDSGPSLNLTSEGELLGEAFLEVVSEIDDGKDLLSDGEAFIVWRSSTLDPGEEFIIWRLKLLERRANSAMCVLVSSDLGDRCLSTCA